jgi:DNA-binding MurR/RpiR family transcriptional regulator
VPRKRSFEDKDILIHPWEVFTISTLAERLKMSESTIRNFMDEGLEYKSVKSFKMFTGQQVLNFLNDEFVQYSEKVVNKVLETTGVKLK